VQFGPDPQRHYDPYEGLSDDEVFDDFFKALQRERLKQISIRLPESMIERTKALARERNVSYQTLIKALLESALSRFDRAS
jgi:predicted DNA binding CopG/RHH family protein